MPTAQAEFRFLDPGELIDGELSLRLLHQHPGNPAKGWVPSYDFEMRRVGVGGAVGHINFRAITSNTVALYSGNFGYSVEPAHRGRHFAERAVRLLLPLAKAHGHESIWITCNPDNLPSRRTCERLGSRLVEIVSLPADNEMYLRGERQKCRYLLGT